MTTRAQVVAAARGWIGTPFLHQGRARHAGCDCAGLIIGVAHELGLTDFDTADYARTPHGGRLRQVCDEQLRPIPEREIAAGDVLLLKFIAEPHHLAFGGDYVHGGLSLIHAYARGRGVVEHRLDATWRARIVAAYRLPGVA